MEARRLQGKSQKDRPPKLFKKSKRNDAKLRRWIEKRSETEEMSKNWMRKIVTYGKQALTTGRHLLAGNPGLQKEAHLRSGAKRWWLRPASIFSIAIIGKQTHMLVTRIAAARAGVSDTQSHRPAADLFIEDCNFHIVQENRRFADWKLKSQRVVDKQRPPLGFEPIVKSLYLWLSRGWVRIPIVIIF